MCPCLTNVNDIIGLCFIQYWENQTLVTIEDNVIAGGAGSGVNEYMLAQGLSPKVLNIGLPDQFIKHGTQAEIHRELGLDCEGIVQKINQFIG